MVVIPYVENVYEAVARLMRKHSVPVAMKPYKTLKSVLVHPKDKQEKEDLTECVVTNGGVKSAQTPPCDILFFSVCLESPENQVTQTPFRIKRKI